MPAGAKGTREREREVACLPSPPLARTPVDHPPTKPSSPVFTCVCPFFGLHLNSRSRFCRPFALLDAARHPAMQGLRGEEEGAASAPPSNLGRHLVSSKRASWFAVGHRCGIAQRSEASRCHRAGILVDRVDSSS